MDVLTDDHEREQVVRQWWHEYWKPITLGIVIALAGLVGFRQWQSYQLHSSQEQAYTLYQEQAKLAMPNATLDSANKFIEEHKDVYGALLALDVASVHAVKGNYEDAVKNVNFAKENGGELIAPLAGIAQAKIQTQLGKYDDALKTVDGIKDESYAIECSELKGDILFAKGDTEGAHNAYKKAIDLSVEKKVAINSLLQMKFDNVIKTGEKPAYITARENIATQTK
ncbi:MAG TPA: hypothetical protein DCR21_02455 [Succinivibrionaceae bacterium]|nr:hypothetical protein [Succinivibrionaceae bacterium]